ncbi:uncharacterized protein BX663DRAFT_506891 [Cokeromyces recurvatus]|uniref:uncharacterized protein n=1 Tax=Cokeromyces recurvatus TaxID=90255 RepID=UPI00221FA605|nr:uncharacterized protein BX663DRAFT_506891 [Cokeromyces recurvatus]KAI7903558.1 hypothetical protein BX663DRAFT_506891 [Cokeromyces recurvatus]
MIGKRLGEQNENVFPLSIKRSKAVWETALFELSGILTKAHEPVSVITIKGCQRYTYIEEITKLFNLSASMNPYMSENEICISSYVPLSTLNNVVRDNKTSNIMSIIPEGKIVEYSKLRCFLTVNRIAGIVSHANMPTVAFVILPCSELKQLDYISECKETELKASAYNDLCGIYLRNLPRRPKSMDNSIEYHNVYDVKNDETSSNMLFTWDKVTSYLKFPDELKELKTTSKFYIIGNSHTASQLKWAINNIKQYYNPSKSHSPDKPVNIMMFDRQDNSLFNKRMLTHKKHKETQIWEYGFSDSDLSNEIIPPCQVFPNDTGGYITTDIQNIIHNPSIMSVIDTQIKLLNEHSPVINNNGGWNFILPYNFIHHLNEAMKTAGSIEKVQMAIIAIAVALSKNIIQIIRIWSTETIVSSSLLQSFILIERCNYKNSQYFGYIDDIHSIPENIRDQHLSIDFIRSDQIFSTYK